MHFTVSLCRLVYIYEIPEGRKPEEDGRKPRNIASNLQDDGIDAGLQLQCMLRPTFNARFVLHSVFLLSVRSDCKQMQALVEQHRT